MSSDDAHQFHYSTVVTGNDTIDFAGGLLLLASSGEAGNDTITIAGNCHTSTVTGGAGADSIDFTGGNVSSSKIVGGAGNDTFNFGSFCNATLVQPSTSVSRWK